MVSPWAFCGVVVLLWCVVVSCCAVRCPVVSCVLCRVLRCRAAMRCCAGLFVAWVWLYLLEKPPQNFVKYFFFFFAFEKKKKFFLKKNYTRPNTLACSKTMFVDAPYVLPVVLDVLGPVLVRGVVERVGVHC